MHPWCIMQWDANLDIHKRIIELGSNLGVEFVTYGAIADEVRKAAQSQ
jgi:hypothetical protein